MAQDSTSIVSQLGAESKITSLFGGIVNSLTNSNGGISAQDLTTKILNQYGGEIRQISAAKYDYIYGIFKKETESEQLAKAYALLTVDAVKTLNITVDELFESTSDPIKFSNLGLTLLNHYRPLTSQVGRTITISQAPDYISRMVSY
tara:strand:+ start:1795 stop:2235 length:441 start_codon:yes stop_codon:yes gene_type:complete